MRVLYGYIDLNTRICGSTRIYAGIVATLLYITPHCTWPPVLPPLRSSEPRSQRTGIWFSPGNGTEIDKYKGKVCYTETSTEKVYFSCPEDL